MPEIQIDKIVIKHITDEYPDLSYLQQEYDKGDISKEEQLKYKKQDKERLAECGFTWVSIGIVAEAQVSYRQDDYRRLEWLKSDGLWGIDSDSEDGYIKDIEKEQLQSLKEHLSVFGINVSDFDIKAEGCEVIRE